MCNNTNEMKFLTIEWKKRDSVKRQKTDLADSGFWSAIVELFLLDIGRFAVK